MGLFLIVKLILTLVDIGMNITILYKTFEWRTKLLAGFFSNMTHYSMLTAQYRHCTISPVQNDAR